MSSCAQSFLSSSGRRRVRGTGHTAAVERPRASRVSNLGFFSGRMRFPRKLETEIVMRESGRETSTCR